MAAAGKKKHGTFERLEDIMASFEAFNSDMRIGTKQRREKDEERILSIKRQLSSLEGRLETQIERREEILEATRAWGLAAIDDRKRSMAARLEKERGRVALRLDAIRARLASSLARAAVDFEAIPVDIEERGRALAQRLRECMAHFDTESAARVEREGSVVERLGNHESEVAKHFNADRTQRERAYVDLVAMFEAHVARHDKQTEAFGAAFDEKVARLRNAITIEAKTRWREDTELANAMDAYVSKLQLSLHAVNSDKIV
ncbi:hypothetical protein CTAYLR_007354 [Chrysophaeum taylorii]|uniref:SF-assemblin n=1 Tax=Chrysophaeum taylorii TaxID=2483200 RepID=A0AAD7UJR9_9STRA|nr:hypothetical protein CTAYLR_007354 [Chrysophaeum taylorii]